MEPTGNPVIIGLVYYLLHAIAQKYVCWQVIIAPQYSFGLCNNWMAFSHPMILDLLAFLEIELLTAISYFDPLLMLRIITEWDDI